MESDQVIFKVRKLETGRISHTAEYGSLYFKRKEVLKSGKSYFICCHPQCTARLHAFYQDYDASKTEVLPILTR